MRPIACGMIQRLAAAALGLVACSAAASPSPFPHHSAPSMST